MMDDNNAPDVSVANRKADLVARLVWHADMADDLAACAIERADLDDSAAATAAAVKNEKMSAAAEAASETGFMFPIQETPQSMSASMLITSAQVHAQLADAFARAAAGS